MSFGQYPGSQPPPPYGAHLQQGGGGGGYRAGAGGSPDTTLPLPRTGLLAWTISYVVVAIFVLFMPAVTVALSTGRSMWIMIKDGGFSNMAIVLLHPLLTIGVLALGIFVVRGYKHIPAPLLFALSLLPLLISTLGSFLGQRILLGALSGESVSIGQKLRIGAEGYSEIDASVIFGSLSSGLLMMLSAVAVVGSVVSIDTKRMAGDPNPNAATAPKNHWILGSGIAALLVIVAFIVHLIAPSWSGGLASKYSIVMLIAAAVAAGPMFARAMGLMATPLDNNNNNHPAEVRRAGAAILMSAMFVALAVFLLDRASFAFVERDVLSVISGEAIDPSQRARIMGLTAPGIRASSTNLLVDTVVAALLFAPAVAMAVRRPSWGSVCASAGVLLMAIAALGSWNLSRRSGFKVMASSSEALRKMVGDAPSIKASRDTTSVSSINLAVNAAGDVTEVEHSFSYLNAGAQGIAPERSIRFRTLVTSVMSKAPSASSYSSLDSSSGPDSTFLDRRKVLLAGKIEGGPALSMPAAVEYTSVFLAPELIGYEVTISKRLLADASTSDVGFGAQNRGTSAYLRFTSPDQAQLACSSAKENFVEAISFAAALDPSAITTRLEDALKKCGSTSSASSTSTPLFIAPHDDATADDVYKMLSIVPMSRSMTVQPDGPTRTTGRPIELTIDRTNMNAWFDAHPAGPRPDPPSAFGGLGGIGLGGGSPSLRQGAIQVNGRLPPEVIQRIVRQNFGRFRLCYENGLRKDPSLSGRVSVKFVIDRSGAVSTAQDGGSDLPDSAVVACIVRGFGNLSFPQPEGGIVTVVYPIIFQPAK